ncbi:MAG: ATP-binding protein [Caldimicrobium sp.]|nr:ATP-binding protein [Caldimicrobium sp.]
MFFIGWTYFNMVLKNIERESLLLAEKHYTKFIYKTIVAHTATPEEAIIFERMHYYETLKSSLSSFDGIRISIQDQGEKDSLLFSRKISFTPLGISFIVGFSKGYVISWYGTRILFLFTAIFLSGALIYYFQMVFLKKIKNSLERITKEITSKMRPSPVGFYEIDLLIDNINQALERERDHAERMATQQKKAALGTLAGGYAHEFNNLLQILSSNLELIEYYVQKKECGNLLPLLIKSRETILRGQNLARRILYFTKITETEKTNLSQFLRENFETLRIFVPRAINLELELPSTDLLIPLSEESFKEVLINLVKNAFEAIEEREKLDKDFEKKISIRARKEQEFTVLEISDTGIGMSEEVKSRLFEPFFTTKGIGRGTGLGLYMVHNIIHNAQGNIEVESEYLRGTTFKLYLPLVKEETLTPAPESLPLKSRSPTEQRFKKVLIVDDEPDIREALRDFIKDLVEEVITAENALEAWKILEKQPFDLCFVDLFMPEKGGDWLLKKVKTMKEKSPKIVIMTGYSGEMEDSIQEALKEGLVIKILRKPFSLQEIVKILTQKEGEV